MIPTDALFDAYLDANILLIEGLALWLLACAALRAARIRLAHRTQLWLLNGLFLTVMASPVVVGGFVAARSAGLVPQGVTLNLTDYLLALFLNGRIEMQAIQFEQVLAVREGFTHDVARFDGLLGQSIAALLIVGAVLFASQTARNIMALRRTIRSSYRWRRSGRVELRLSDSIAVPFSTRSLWRRYVVIPSGLLARPQDLAIVMKHEFQHLRQSDVEWEIAMECLRPFFFWNPAFGLWKRRVEELREFAVDEQVLARARITPAAYAACLVGVCEDMMRSRAPAALPAVGLLQMHRRPLERRAPAALIRRITVIFDRNDPAPARGLPLLLLGLMVGTLGMSTLAIQKPPSWSQDRLMLATIVNLERLDAINALGSGYGR